MSTTSTKIGMPGIPRLLQRDYFIWMAVSVLTLLGTLTRMDLWLSDVMGQPATQQADYQPVAVVAIDQQSFMEAGIRWPWPRSRHSELLNAAKSAGARAVVFDIVFDQPSEDDAVFAKAISDFDTVVLAAERVVTLLPQGRIESVARPVRPLGEAAAAMGLASLPLDPDGRLRRLPDTDDTLAFATAQFLSPDAAPEALPNRYIRFRKGDAAPKVFSYAQVLNTDERLPPGALEGLTLIVGLTLPASPAAQSIVGDEILLPGYAAPQTGGHAPGVMAHAQALATILAGDAHRRAPIALELAVMLAMIGLSFACIVLSRNRLRACVLVTLAAMIGLLAIQYILRANGFILMTSASLLGFFLANAATITAAGLRNHRERLRLVRGFGKYVAPPVLGAILENPDLPELGGTSREISVIISDLEGYTQLMNQLPPAEGAQLLSTYLERLGQVVIAHEGMIDQFIGDSIIAIFNAPLKQDDHARRALDCALAIEREGLVFQADMKAKGHTVGVTRIGVDCGSAVVGNFGAQDRFHYTAIGEVMNIASRLEAANKQTSTRLLVSEALFLEAGCPDTLRSVGELSLRGIGKPIKAYTPNNSPVSDE